MHCTHTHTHASADTCHWGYVNCKWVSCVCAVPTLICRNSYTLIFNNFHITDLFMLMSGRTRCEARRPARRPPRALPRRSLQYIEFIAVFQFARMSAYISLSAWQFASVPQRILYPCTPRCSLLRYRAASAAPPNLLIHTTTQHTQQQQNTKEKKKMRLFFRYLDSHAGARTLD